VKICFFAETRKEKRRRRLPMLLKIIAETIIGHNRVINNRYLLGYFPPEERLKRNQATQRAIHTTPPSVAVPFLLLFTRLSLIARASTPVHLHCAPMMRRHQHRLYRGRTNFTANRSCRHLCATGRQRHRPCKQGQDRNQQYHGGYSSHHKPNIAKNRQYLKIGKCNWAGAAPFDTPNKLRSAYQCMKNQIRVTVGYLL
jgi:hypothetical protein